MGVTAGVGRSYAGGARVTYARRRMVEVRMTVYGGLVFLGHGLHFYTVPRCLAAYSLVQ